MGGEQASQLSYAAAQLHAKTVGPREQFVTPPRISSQAAGTPVALRPTVANGYGLLLLMISCLL
jgi:hypothetical protein